MPDVEVGGIELREVVKRWEDVRAAGWLAQEPAEDASE
jgi:hypothetical protein